MTQGMPGVSCSMIKKRAIMFIDGNNWYHNVKSVVEKPRLVDFKKLKKLIEDKFNLDILEIRYYNSVPDIGVGEDVYYKHMVFLARLGKSGIKVYTRKLKKVKENGKIFRIEKGVDMMISSDMLRKVFLEGACDTCVLISGDSDFVPIMKLIKDIGKEVLTVSVLKGYARELLRGDFRFWILKKSDINKCISGYKGN